MPPPAPVRPLAAPVPPSSASVAPARDTGGQGPQQPARVAVIMGSDSDLPTMQPAVAVLERFGVRPGQVSFQSSNRWDIAGATRFGFQTVWINRGGLPDEYPDLPPGRMLPGLSGLAP